MVRAVTPLGVVFLLTLAGCLQGADSPAAPDPEGPQDEDLPVVRHPVRCHLMDLDHNDLRDGTCIFTTVTGTTERDVDAEGVASVDFTEGTTLRVTGTAPGHTERTVRLTVDAPKSVEMTLAPAGSPPRPDPSSPPNGTDTDTGTSPVEPPEIPADPPVPRAWTDPVTVTDSGNEPHLVVAPDGTIYYSPTSHLMRSTDGGRTWVDVSPALTEGLPTLGSDSSVSLAPDGSVWWSRYWGYADATIGCTSTDKGGSWTCDNAAVPGATDRMWVVGLDSEHGYLQTNEGLYHHVWAYTDTGSLKYTPYATSTALLAVRNGNMVYDTVHEAVWQIEWLSGSQRLLRVDGANGLVPSSDTGIQNTYALPWLAVWDGVLWTTGEVSGPDGSRSVLAARSMDAGETWDTFPIQSAAKSVTFSYIAAGPDGRVALVYYGSDKEGPSTENGGAWSLYVAETDDGLAEDPIWIETRLVETIHTGNICIGLNCEDSGDDPEARFSGDLIGAWIDGQGNAHIAYNDDTSGDTLNQYLRQTLV